MGDGIFNMREFSELQSLSKHSSEIAKNIDKVKVVLEKSNNNTDKKSIERQKIDAINDLSKTIKESTDKIVGALVSLGKKLPS